MSEKKFDPEAHTLRRLEQTSAGTPVSPGERWRVLKNPDDGTSAYLYRIVAGEKRETRPVGVLMHEADADLICALHNGDWLDELQPAWREAYSNPRNYVASLEQALAAERERADMWERRLNEVEAEGDRHAEQYRVRAEQVESQLQAEREKAARYEAALRACRSESVVLGYDAGNAAVVRIVDDALTSPTTEEGR